MGNLKNRTRIGVSIDNNLLKQLDELRFKTRIDRSKLIDEAIELLLEKHNNKK